MNKIVYFILAIILMIGSINNRAQALDCPEVPDCPAPPGDCARGYFEVGNKRTLNYTYYKCEVSNAACTKDMADKGMLCDQYPSTDPYGSTLRPLDFCRVYLANQEFCDYTTWTTCCSPGGSENGTPTPTEEGGEPGNPTNSPTAAPPSVPPAEIRGQIHRDQGASLSGPVCTQATSDPLTVNGLKLLAPGSSALYINYSRYSLVAPTGNNYTVTLDLSQQSGYISYACTCPPPLDPSYPFLCQYTNVSSPTEDLNFYLSIAGVANSSWFRVWGGNLFGRQGVFSRVSTYVTPGGEFTGEAERRALNMPLAINPQSLSYDTLSKGFAIANTATVMSQDGSRRHQYFHQPEYTAGNKSLKPNINAYAPYTDLSTLSYDYFRKLAEEDLHVFGDGSDHEPLLADWTTAPWWLNNEVNYLEIKGNVSIDETQGFQLNANQKLVVFVDGKLTFEDSNPSDAVNAVTSVAKGGFLAFFVKDDLVITPSVTRLEGVMIADHDLIIQSKMDIDQALPDLAFTGAGTFVGWHDVVLKRNFLNLSTGDTQSRLNAVENFVFRPDFLSNWPVKLKSSLSNWREVDPQQINNPN